jgi:hypothetical protein
LLTKQFHQINIFPFIKTANIIGISNFSFVVNKVNCGGYGYGGNGKYGYAYGSGYFEDEGPPPGKFSKWFGGLNLKKSPRKKTKEKV